MKPPVILTVDDDPQVLRAVQRDLNARYRRDYKIIAADSGEAALELLTSLRQRNETIALILSDQRMPGMQGVELLFQAKAHYPDAKKVLLTAYADTNVAIKAINDVQLDYYLLKPWDPPEQSLYPPLDDLLAEWQASFRPDVSRTRIIGFQWSPASHALRDFLAANLIPYQFIDAQVSNESDALLQLYGLDKGQLPVVLFEDGSHKVRPSVSEVAEKVGLQIRASQPIYDLVIVGAGPAGLAASVYGASEGLKTLLIERRAPGGQAGASSRIENYLGFPAGLSGAELTKRAVAQTTRFGTEVLSPKEVKGIEIKDGYKILTLDDGSIIRTRTILIATGVDYRALEAKNIEKYTGAGVYYGSVITEAYACRNNDVFVVGGGNSAGQAAMYLSRFAAKVHIVIRGEGLAATMSSYLIDQIAATPNIEIHPHTVIREICGEERVERVELYNAHTQTAELHETPAVFIFIGTKPGTEWLPAHIARDDKGFIYTGRDFQLSHLYAKMWRNKREPYPLETSIPGIFASGDVRVGAMGRVAAAVGEGSMAVRFVHQYLAEE